MSLNVTFRRASIEAAMEFGSLKELAGYVGEECVLLTKIFGEDMEIVVKGLSSAEGSTAIASGTVEGAETGEQAARKPGRPKKNQPDPATAVAPPPAPIPGATPPAPATPSPELAAQVAGANGGIPPFLDRTAAAPPTPPAPPPAPPAPIVPPSGILAGKVIGNLEARATDDVTKKALVDWLAGPSYGIVQPGSTFDDTIAAIRLMPDDKLGQVATALSVA
jgi:hypothetical protein